MNRTMYKAKKLILSIAVMIVGIVAFTTISSAYYVGQQLTVTFNDYLTNDDIYCVEHNQALKSSNSYKIISEVDISGDTSTG